MTSLALNVFILKNYAEVRGMVFSLKILSDSINYETIQFFIRLMSKERSAEMNMKKILIVILATALAFGLIGCGKNNVEVKIGVRGEITNVRQGQDNKVTFIMVEGNLESDTMYDKASVAITGKTKIIKKDSKDKLSKDDLKQGMKVEVVMEGPIRESYPVQGDAKEVRILD